MNHFSYVEKLLDGVEVVWFPISEVTERTTNIKWRETSESHQYIDLTSVNVDTKKIIETTEVKASNAPSRAQKLVKKDDVLFATTRPTQMRYCLIDEEYDGAVASTGYCVLRVKRDVILPKWILHLISSSDFKKYLEENQSGSAYPAISDAKVKDFSIPIPCPDNPEKSLAIQAEIVRILDAFTAMTAELTAELNIRKKQYNYYRDQLLSFEEGDVEWKNLEDVASFRRGSFPQPYGNSEWYDGEGCMPFVQVADVADFGFTLHQTTKQKISKLAQPKSIFVEKGTVVVSLQGTIGRVAITQYDSYVDRTLAIFTSYKEDINKKYFAHQLKAKFDLEKEFARGSTLKTITKQEFSKFQIPIPPIEEQNRIVALLDKFDTLTHSIKQGLPREIELRQKQYEYYRDLLLSFPKSHSDEAA
ncbi:restriction endonuclease subunit S [Acinetobacter pittii]|uniref:restriction endonuclease subunit S n=1 Tax=Acinetobacter pittii TaxID=48296 RepID=UPI000992447D|nr:restriction endonuclease subunit S [Acinetobacter pittii]MCU4456424.1 restriction endonuclease subunit S [Acinetobacter pittii]MCU4459790.1 restriction endonuclease subunit S [Acinetobacter pittii]OOS63973.1 restriction endonuclease [Acinetobacter pittii]